LTWEGWDGSLWDLRNLSGGVIVTNEGIQGLHDPEWELEVSESPSTAGRRRLDWRGLPRPVRLPVYLWNDDDSAAFLDLLARFQRSFHPLKPGWLTVRTAQGARRLQLYKDSAGDFTYTRDPIYEGYTRLPVAATAEMPWWRGELVTRSWEQSSSEPFFNNGNLWVTSGAALETAEIENPGELPAWVRWRLLAAEGGAVTATLTVDGGDLGTPEVPAGSELVIDTDPAVSSADMDGVEVDGLVDPWDPRPVPEEGIVPVQLILSGQGRVTMELEPLYFRAFG
jgi:hypothetical protein